MKYFSELVTAIDSTTRTTGKLDALVKYLQKASDADKLWCVALLTGKRPKRPVKTSLMREWAAELAGIPLWLFEESYFVVGDLAETVALLLPPATGSSESSLSTRMTQLKNLSKMDDAEKKESITAAWMQMTQQERFVFNKLITGGFRIGVSQKLMVKALARFLNEDENVLAHRLMGDWNPVTDTFQGLLTNPTPGERSSQPYPFYLAYPLEESPESLGDIHDWQLEYKWDGIRGQLIFRKGACYIWSRGEELVTHQYPELEAAAAYLPYDCVLDGEIMAFDGGQALSFNHLQKRIGRKSPSRKVMQDSPVVLICYDLLELAGDDWREKPLQVRRAKLEELITAAGSPQLRISQRMEVASWQQAMQLRENSRALLAEGLMIKNLQSAYQVGRKRGDWWKWKVDPLSIDAVLIYAMRGHGRRANLFSDYTFAVWEGDDLVPFTKAYSGLTDKEMQEVDRFVKHHTIERFGPVRSVKPELVFEIGFEGIASSSRHKSGIALRFPRMLRWRRDKIASEANTLEDLRNLLKTQSLSSNPQKI